ncbi:uncharacterized protein A1O9_05465 [Exophiala aquamarina CBS 119918]|uniref:Methyltransferase domain-containing protein n=1 Tax=Exophiala aquamarina CBS 119918 TaxID=1182545 RepID=A0A072PE13_9EURO|nr:uncharacterized protein A1O9_05465 [Exophiala aquamarina CBS 119918]KEF57548.1 hypothetical protein A1O9_05465 [Exophiala aquamarina CBS 119918]
MRHHIYKLIIGGALFRAPIADNHALRTLDLGCGTGIWRIEIADEQPTALVIGTDLSPIQLERVPPNCKFYVDDIESEWAYPPAEHFDYIQGRALCGSIADWLRLFSQSLANLKPGGLIEMQEYSCIVLSDDGIASEATHLLEWAEQMNEASKKSVKELRVCALLKKNMEDVGFVDVHEEIYKVPSGPWAKGKRSKEVGLYYRAQFVDAVEPFTMTLFTRVLGSNAEDAKKDAKKLVDRFKTDLINPKLHMYVHLYYIWGSKPK